MKKTNIFLMFLILINSITSFLFLQTYLDDLQSFRLILNNDIMLLESNFDEERLLSFDETAPLKDTPHSFLSIRETNTWQGTTMEIVNHDGQVIERPDYKGEPREPIYVKSPLLHFFMIQIFCLVLLFVSITKN